MVIQYNPGIVTSGLSVYLDAANIKSYPGTGTVWYDLSGNNRNATIVGTPTFTSPYFTGITDSNYFTLSNVGMVPRTNDFTYSMWVNFAAIDSLDTLFENGSWTDTLLFRYQTNTFTVYCEGVLGGSLSVELTTDTWYNFTLIRSAGTVSLYSNGVSTGTPFVMATDINLANTNIFLMRSQHAANQYTNGKISIYNRALGIAEVQQNFNALRPRFGV